MVHFSKGPKHGYASCSKDCFSLRSQILNSCSGFFVSNGFFVVQTRFHLFMFQVGFFIQ
jgi:hypothetical protein